MDNVTDVYNYIAEWSPNITLHCDLGAGKHTPSCVWFAYL